MRDASPGTRERGETVWAVIIEPGDAANVYHWDDRAQALSLSRVERPRAPRGADLARIPLVRRGERDGVAPHDSSAPGMLALVLADPPNPPGVWLRIRLLGALDLGGQQGAASDVLTQCGRAIAFAVPVADPALADIGAWDDLPLALRQRAECAAQHLRATGEPLPLGQNSPGWRDAHATMALFRSARATLAQRDAERRSADEVERHERLTTSGDTFIEAFTQRMRRDAPGARTASPAPAANATTWRGLSGVSAAEWRARGAAALGEAEDLLQVLPQRFLRYLGELLAPDERALFFVETPPFTLRAHDEGAALSADSDQRAAERSRWRLGPLTRLAAPARIHTRHMQAGLLLITDRQALLLRDFAAPHAGAAQLGYVATSWPLGRLVAASVIPPGQRLATVIAGWPQRIQARLAPPTPGDEVGVVAAHAARLALALEGRNGVQVTGCALPAEAQSALERAARTLNGFIPLLGAAGAGDRRLRVAPAVRPWRPTEVESRELASLGGLLAAPVVAALEAATARGLEPDPDVLILAQGRTPAMSASRPETAALLTLTPERVLLATLAASRGRGMAAGQTTAQASLRALPLGCLTSVTLQYSLAGSWLRLAYPDAPGEPGAPLGQPLGQPACEVIHVAFPSPLLAPFRALRNRLLTLLGTGSTLGTAEEASLRLPTPRTPASR